MFGLLRILKPMRIIKRRALLKGLFGGDRKWLVIGGVVFMWGRMKAVLGFGEPQTVMVEEIAKGDRVVLAHERERPRRRRRS